MATKAKSLPVKDFAIEWWPIERLKDYPRNARKWSGQAITPTGNRSEERVGHGTQKPVECMRRPIENNSSPGQAVYDPFLGSGTTIIAAEQTGRSCHGMELAPNYCDVIVRRWQNFTGQQATLESTGQPFDAVADERSAVHAA